MSIRTLIFLMLLSLTGCASTPPDTTETEADSAPAIQVADEPEKVTAPPEPPEILERPFPDESLYPLLVAEFAMRRRDYETALENYMSQAPLLQDAGVSAHTSRLAQYLQKDDKAITSTQLWVELEPENLEARLTLANLLARSGRGPEALPHMSYIMRAGGEVTITAIANGFHLLSAEAQGEMLAEIDTLQREFPDNAQLIVSEALLLEALELDEKALEVLQAAFEIDPLQLQAVVMDVKLRQDLGQVEGIYERLLTALNASPDNHRLRMQYARLLTRTDLDEARKQFQLLLDLAPSDPDLLFSVALIDKEIGDLEASKTKFEKLVGLGQRRDEAHYYLGRIAEDQERYEDSLMHYMQVKPGREFVNATRRLGSILLSAERTDDHGDYFDQLRDRFPDFQTQLYAVEVESLNNFDKYELTTEVLDKALRDFPTDTNLQYMRAMAFEQLGNLDSMEEDLRDILSREPENSTVLNALGYILANKTDRYAEAQVLIEQALLLEPDQPAILDSFGWVRFRLGDYQEALEYLKRAYEVFPDPEVAAHLGEVLWTLGESEAALLIWKKSLEEHPGHEILIETIRRLGVLESAEP